MQSERLNVRCSDDDCEVDETGLNELEERKLDVKFDGIERMMHRLD